MRTAALVVAAGRGARAADPDHQPGQGPKQFVGLGGQAVLARSLAAFLDHSQVDAVLVVIHADDQALYDECMIGLASHKLHKPVLGGPRRQDSVRIGLEALSEQSFDTVLIHDAARPLIQGTDIDNLLAVCATHPGAILAVPVADTLKRAVDGTETRSGEALIAGTVARAGLWRALTPQAFQFDEILEAHQTAAEVSQDFTDDASIAEFAGLEVALVPGRSDNIKITTAEDFAVAERLLGDHLPDVRTGHGYDVHRFGPGSEVVLCGVTLAHTHKLVGHSDADVGLHALTDAVLGALGDGDIGAHFPPSDSRWKDAASSAFLKHAAGLVDQAGGRLTHLDVTLICEAPKIGPHRDAMRARIAEIAGIAVARVGVKATTTEGLGFTGRGEGIAAMATATVMFAGKT